MTEHDGTTNNLSRYDLVPKIAKHLDPHLTIAVIDFLIERQQNNAKIYTTKSLLKAKHWLLGKTLMVDYRNAVYKELHDLPPEENEPGYAEDREKVVEKYTSASRSAKEISSLISDPKAAGLIESGLDPNSTDQDPTPPAVRSMGEAISILYEFAAMTYNIGNFDSCHDVLFSLQNASSGNWECSLGCLWGRLACEIMMSKTDTILDIFNTLRERIEQNQLLDHAEVLLQRTWLLHWSLFVLFDSNRLFCEGIMDLFLQPQYLNTISISCPWLLRYLAIAIIVNRRRRSNIKDFINVIQSENLSIDDPFVQFVKNTYVDYDLDSAKVNLSLCRQLMYFDFFTNAFVPDFLENARLALSESYFRIHHHIDILDLCDKFGMEVSEGEIWIADVIGNTHCDAGIDAISNVAVINVQKKSVYQQILESTKNLVYRTSILTSVLERREQELLEDKSKMRV